MVYVLNLPFFLRRIDVTCHTVAHNLGSESKKAAGIPMFNAIGQCGSVLGSHIFPKTDGPRYRYVHLSLVAGVIQQKPVLAEKVLQVRLRIHDFGLSL
jgi:hypothetical protein